MDFSFRYTFNSNKKTLRQKEVSSELLLITAMFRVVTFATDGGGAVDGEPGIDFFSAPL